MIGEKRMEDWGEASSRVRDGLSAAEDEVIDGFSTAEDLYLIQGDGVDVGLHD
jgi:hypothetical protein